MCRTVNPAGAPPVNGAMDRKDRFIPRCFWTMLGAGALGGALYGAGAAFSMPALKTASIPAFVVAAAAASPLVLIAGLVALFIVVVAALVPVALPVALLQYVRFRRAARAIDALDAREASEQEYEEAFARLRKIGWGACSLGSARLGDLDRPSRRRWLPFAEDDAVRKVAIDAGDALAPFAWGRVMAIEAPDAEVVRRWAKAVDAEDPFAACGPPSP